MFQVQIDAFLKTRLVGAGALFFWKNLATHRPIKRPKKLEISIKANVNIKQALFNEVVFNQKRSLYENCHVNSKLMRN